MSRIVFLDGAFLDAERALLPPTDVGLLYGLGSFETVRLYEGRAFLADRHEARLRDALDQLGLTVPPFDLASVLEALSARNALPEARGSVILTGGVEEEDGSTPHPRLYAEVSPLPPWAPPSPRHETAASRHVDVHIVSSLLGGVQPVHGLKTLNYLPNYLARREARRAGAHEAILRSASGELLEGATSNFFLVVGGALVTPPTEGRALPGVTRGVILEEADRLGVCVSEKPVFEADLAGADEAFLTSTLREVLPIAGFGPRRLSATGPVTERFHAAYRERVRSFLAALRNG